MPFNSRPFDTSTDLDAVGGLGAEGVYGYLERLMKKYLGNSGVTGAGLRGEMGANPIAPRGYRSDREGDPARGVAPTAVSTPDNSPVNPGTVTKTDGMGGGAGGGAGVGPGLSNPLSRNWSGVPYPVDGGPSNSPPPSSSHIRFSVPGVGGEMGPMTDYSPETTGISAYAGQGGLGRPELGPASGVQGRPGGGGFGPSQQDWSKVANPEAFDAYDQPLRDAARQAEQVKLQRSVSDPLWEERGKAKIWTDAQTASQTGIIESLMKNIDEREAAAIAAAKQDPLFLSLPPDQQQKKLAEAAGNFAAERTSLIERYRFSSSAMPGSALS